MQVCVFHVEFCDTWDSTVEVCDIHVDHMGQFMTF